MNIKENQSLNYLGELEYKLINPNNNLSQLSAREQYEIIANKVAKHPEAITPPPALDNNELLNRLEKSKQSKIPLKVKFGIDPTGSEIHIGHAISLLMLRRFQRMGHSLNFIVGDFTAKIGDPSGRLASRPVLTDEQIKENMSTYLDQASRIIDLNENVNVSYNSEWHNPITMQEWLPMLQKISASQIFQRKDFQQRISKGGSVSMAEMMYALFMGYDSVVLKPDVEIGGIDQFLNLHWCRELMSLNNQNSEVFITVDLLAGSTGEKDEDGRFMKMSKSQGNYIPVLENPNEMYGKVMSIPDDLMWIWYRELTEISELNLEELRNKVIMGEIHPRVAKQLLSRVIVGTFNYFDHKVIEESEQNFENKFGKAKSLVPNDIKIVLADPDSRLLDILSNATGRSKQELKKMVLESSTGIKILEGSNYSNVSRDHLNNLRVKPSQELVIKIGKKSFFRIIGRE